VQLHASQSPDVLFWDSPTTIPPQRMTPGVRRQASLLRSRYRRKIGITGNRAIAERQKRAVAKGRSHSESECGQRKFSKADGAAVQRETRVETHPPLC